MRTKKMRILAIAVLLIVQYGYSQSKNYIDQPYLEIQAKADTLVIPDKIYIGITISETDSKGKYSVEELENKMHKKLKSLGIDTQDNLVLKDASSNFKKYFLKRQDVHKTKSYSLLVNDALTVGKVLQGMESIGLANVYLEKVMYSKEEELNMILSGRAISKAKKQATYIVQPLGQTIGKAMHVYVNTNHNSYRNMRADEMAVVSYGANSKSAPLAIDFEKIKYSRSVSVKFKLE